MKHVKLLVFAMGIVGLIGCATSAKPKLSTFENMGKNSVANMAGSQKTFAQDENFVVLITKPSDSLESLAEKYLGDADLAWIIADFNDISTVVAKREIVIPLTPHNSTGIYPDGYQMIPILCYHRFGDGQDKMTISAEKFRQQMQYLKDNNYQVIAMKDVYEFVQAMGGLPKKSVVITVDDGYRSTHDIAFPILQEFNFHATVFLYTDFLGARDALSWQQAMKMQQSGLVDFQPHSKTHPNMSLPNFGESGTDYEQRIEQEINNPSKKITKFVKNPLHTFAYPYGDTNEMIISSLKEKDYKLGVTVQAGSNAAFAHPYMLRRSMIFGDGEMHDFEKSIITYKTVDLK